MREKYNPKKAEDSQFEEEGEGSIGLKEGDFESETDQKDFNFVEARKIESEKINEKVEKFEASHKGLLKKLPKGIKRELATFLLTLSLTTALSDGIAPKKAFAQERKKPKREKGGL